MIIIKPKQVWPCHNNQVIVTNWTVTPKTTTLKTTARGKTKCAKCCLKMIWVFPHVNQRTLHIWKTIKWLQLESNVKMFHFDSDLHWNLTSWQPLVFQQRVFIQENVLNFSECAFEKRLVMILIHYHRL